MTSRPGDTDGDTDTRACPDHHGGAGCLRLPAPLLAAVGHRQAHAIWTGLKHTLETEPDEATRWTSRRRSR